MIINFLILVALIFIFFRKTIVNLFVGRRSKILTELENAETLEREISEEPKPYTEKEIILPDISAELEAIQSEADSVVALIGQEIAEECTELRREMIASAENEAIEKIKARATEIFQSEAYVKALRAKEERILELILEKACLTPGDIAYIKHHNVLYITLISAFELPQSIVNRIDDFTKAMVEAVGGKTSLWVKTDESLIGGFSLRIGDTIYDGTIKEALYQLERRVRKEQLSGEETTEELYESIKSRIDLMQPQISPYQVGRVISVSDGICWMDGLADIMYGEVVEFECGEKGMVLDIQPARIGCVIYGEYEHIESGSRVRRAGRIASVRVGEELLGRVVDALGHAIDGRKQIRSTIRRPIECAAPAIIDRAAVNTPLHTGIKAIDALIPIGRGQRELIIGDRQTGKSSIAIDTIINQKGKNVICIYVAIGQKETTVADIKNKLEQNGAMSYTVIVAATASNSASLQYIAPFAGAAMGEYFMYEGKDVLIVFDDLSKHAVAYRELSLLLHRPSGREAFPGDIFYLHSRLLERSAHLCDALGGGSMTALPIIETLAGDISSYIPTNVISITDGQIFLDTELFYEGQRPAVNVGLSVSRVGGAAQTPLLKQVSGSIRMKLAQYRELAGFAQFGTDIDSTTKKALDSGSRMQAALKQPRFAPLPDYKQALLIFAVASGFADSVKTEAMEEFEESLYRWFDSNKPELVELLGSGKKLTAEGKQALLGALNEFSEVL